MNEMLETLNRLCAFESVSAPSANPDTPYGEAVHDALCYMLDLCASFGFRTKNCENRIGWAEIGEGKELIGILAHLDVVPAGEGWDYPAYAATSDGEKIYGRGVTDDKGPAVACVYAMRDILKSGIKLSRRIRIIFGQTEETGEWTDMEYYCAHEEMPTAGFTPDADFPAVFAEKGILIGTLRMPLAQAGLTYAKGGLVPNAVPDFAEVTIDGKTYSATGIAAHGSTPEDGENAISKVLSQVSCPFANFYNDCIGFDINGERMGIGFSDDVSGRLTLNAGKLWTDENDVCLAIDIRYPVTCTKSEVTDGIAARIAQYGVSYSADEHMAPVYMEKDGAFMQSLLRAYERVTGRHEEPIAEGGGTYARAMPNIVAFGPMLPGRELTEHGKNEYILYEDFLLLREIYREALREAAI